MTDPRTKFKAPDPLHAHGAWVYLCISILAGVLAAIRQEAIAATCSGIGFLGVFVMASALAKPGRRAIRFTAGFALLVMSAVAGIALGADPIYLAYGAVAVFPAGAAAWFALRHGFQSPPALAFAVVTLVVAAPAAACAGGTPHWLGFLLLALLAPFFAWRTAMTRRALKSRHDWTKPELRALGWREAAIALAWTAAAVAIVHVAAR